MPPAITGELVNSTRLDRNKMAMNFFMIYTLLLRFEIEIIFERILIEDIINRYQAMNTLIGVIVLEN